SRDAQGNTSRVSGSIVDITARKRAEQATREAEERYRTLIELAPDGVMVSSGGIVEYANPAAARILKAGNVQRLLGTRTEEYVQPDARERYRERAAYLEAGPGTTAFEER